MVKLAPLREEDSPILYEWLQDRELRLNSTGFEFISLRHHQKWFENIQVSKDRFNVGIRTIEEDRLVGLGHLFHINQVYRNAEFGIRFPREELGKGYGTIAARLVCAHAFDDLNMHRLYFHLRGDNEAGVKLAEKIGFQIEGRLRQHGYHDGKYYDWLVLGMMRDEFIRS